MTFQNISTMLFQRPALAWMKEREKVYLLKEILLMRLLNISFRSKDF